MFFLFFSVEQKHRPLVLEANGPVCKQVHAKFEFLNEGKIKHVISGMCLAIKLSQDKSEGFFNLEYCINGTRFHHYAPGKTFGSKCIIDIVYL